MRYWRGQLDGPKSSRIQKRSFSRGGVGVAGADPNPNKGPKPVWSTSIQWEAAGGGRGYRGRGITHSEVHSQEKGGVVVRVPNTSLSRDVQDVQGGVIGHKGTHVVRRPGPATQRGQKEVSRAAEDLGKDRLPEGPIQG